MSSKNAFFQQFIDEAILSDKLIVQPRMGFSCKESMKNGLIATKNLNIPAIGTITIDSFTRVRDFEKASRAIKMSKPLNGYPIVSYSTEENKKLISKVRSIDFPVQVRHGSPTPEEIFRATIRCGIDAIEGGPISYCLPYSRVPIKESIDSWRTCCKIFAKANNGQNHIESFGGCMMGQLCPPSLLIAITILEAIFFEYYGIKSISLSLTQGYNSQQDLAALRVLKKLSAKHLGEKIKQHIVYYTFMGKFPKTINGAKSIISESAIIAKKGGARRLIVKTIKEAYQIPTLEDNLEALLLTNKIANQNQGSIGQEIMINTLLEEQIYTEAKALIESVLNISKDPSIAIEIAFNKGYLDVPFCLHQSNRKLTLAHIDSSGCISWTRVGNLQISDVIHYNKSNVESNLNSKAFLRMLSYNELKYDSYKKEIYA